MPKPRNQLEYNKSQLTNDDKVSVKVYGETYGSGLSTPPPPRDDLEWQKFTSNGKVRIVNTT